MDTNGMGWERRENLAGKQETAGKQENTTEDKYDVWRGSLSAVAEPPCHLGVGATRPEKKLQISRISRKGTQSENIWIVNIIPLGTLATFALKDRRTTND